MVTLRAIFRALAIGCFLSSLFLCALGLGLLEKLKPQSNPGAKAYARAQSARWHLAMIVKIAGLRIVTQGPKPGPQERFLLLSNHVSYWDIIAIGSLFPLGFLAKEEVRRWVGLGSLAVLVNTIFVKRESVVSRVRALAELRARTRHLSYCVFPEGTTTAAFAPTLLHWFRGQISLARRPGLNIYVVGIHYRAHESLAWIGEESFLPHLMETLRRPQTDVYLNFSRFQDPGTGAEGLKSLVSASYQQMVQVCHSASQLARS